MSEEEVKNTSAHQQLRIWRNLALESTDKYMLEDYPISVEDRATIVAYRQQLRDLPDTYTGQSLDWCETRYLIPPNPLELPV
jgi:hypothetical protein